jgi:hypothetical protein
MSHSRTLSKAWIAEAEIGFIGGWEMWRKLDDGGGTAENNFAFGPPDSAVGNVTRIWWNWQTRYFEVVVPQGVEVQVLLCAPIF